MRLFTSEAQNFRLSQIMALHEEGQTPKRIAVLTQCSEAWVSRVLKRLRLLGKENVKPKDGKRGPKAALSEAQLAELKAVLSGPAKDQGLDTDGWTRTKIAQVIATRYGVQYDLSHICRIVHKINVTLKKPKTYDYRKNPQAVKQWVEERLPALKKKRCGRLPVALC